MSRAAATLPPLDKNLSFAIDLHKRLSATDTDSPMVKYFSPKWKYLQTKNASRERDGQPELLAISAYKNYSRMLLLTYTIQRVSRNPAPSNYALFQTAVRKCINSPHYSRDSNSAYMLIITAMENAGLEYAGSPSDLLSPTYDHKFTDTLEIAITKSIFNIMYHLIDAMDSDAAEFSYALFEKLHQALLNNSWILTWAQCVTFFNEHVSKAPLFTLDNTEASRERLWVLLNELNAELFNSCYVLLDADIRPTQLPHLWQQMQHSHETVDTPASATASASAVPAGGAGADTGSDRGEAVPDSLGLDACLGMVPGCLTLHSDTLHMSHQAKVFAICQTLGFQGMRNAYADYILPQSRDGECLLSDKIKATLSALKDMLIQDTASPFDIWLRLFEIMAQDSTCDDIIISMFNMNKKSISLRDSPLHVIIAATNHTAEVYMRDKIRQLKVSAKGDLARVEPLLEKNFSRVLALRVLALYFGCRKGPISEWLNGLHRICLADAIYEIWMHGPTLGSSSKALFKSVFPSFLVDFKFLSSINRGMSSDQSDYDVVALILFEVIYGLASLLRDASNMPRLSVDEKAIVRICLQEIANKLGIGSFRDESPNRFVPISTLTECDRFLNNDVYKDCVKDRSTMPCILISGHFLDRLSHIIDGAIYKNMPAYLLIRPHDSALAASAIESDEAAGVADSKAEEVDSASRVPPMNQLAIHSDRYVLSGKLSQVPSYCRIEFSGWLSFLVQDLDLYAVRHELMAALILSACKPLRSDTTDARTNKLDKLLDAILALTPGKALPFSDFYTRTTVYPDFMKKRLNVAHILGNYLGSIEYEIPYVWADFSARMNRIGSCGSKELLLMPIRRLLDALGKSALAASTYTDTHYICPVWSCDGHFATPFLTALYSLYEFSFLIASMSETAMSFDPGLLYGYISGILREMYRIANPTERDALQGFVRDHFYLGRSIEIPRSLEGCLDTLGQVLHDDITVLSHDAYSTWSPYQSLSKIPSEREVLVMQRSALLYQMRLFLLNKAINVDKYAGMITVMKIKIDELAALDPMKIDKRKLEGAVKPLMLALKNCPAIDGKEKKYMNLLSGIGDALAQPPLSAAAAFDFVTRDGITMVENGLRRFSSFFNSPSFDVKSVSVWVDCPGLEAVLSLLAFYNANINEGLTVHFSDDDNPKASPAAPSVLPEPDSHTDTLFSGRIVMRTTPSYHHQCYPDDLRRYIANILLPNECNREEFLKIRLSHIGLALYQSLESWSSKYAKDWRSDTLSVVQVMAAKKCFYGLQDKVLTLDECRALIFQFLNCKTVNDGRAGITPHKEGTHVTINSLKARFYLAIRTPTLTTCPTREIKRMFFGFNYADLFYAINTMEKTHNASMPRELCVSMMERLDNNYFQTTSAGAANVSLTLLTYDELLLRIAIEQKTLAAANQTLPLLKLDPYGKCEQLYFLLKTLYPNREEVLSDLYKELYLPRPLSSVRLSVAGGAGSAIGHHAESPVLFSASVSEKAESHLLRFITDELHACYDKQDDDIKKQLRELTTLTTIHNQALRFQKLSNSLVLRLIKYYVQDLDKWDTEFIFDRSASRPVEVEMCTMRPPASGGPS